MTEERSEPSYDRRTRQQPRSRKIPQTFTPTQLQTRYRDLRASAAAAGRPINDTALARELRCRNATISGWRRNPAFLAWLDADARAWVEHLWRPILLKAAHLALQGSIEHMKFLAQFLGPVKATGPGAPQVQVIIGVPRPPATTE